jgi:hypothetical protein
MRGEVPLEIETMSGNDFDMNRDEWDIDEITFSDEGEITLDDLKTSPAIKMAYNRFISQSNWIRWILGC